MDMISFDQGEKLLEILNKLNIKKEWILNVLNIKDLSEINIRQFNNWLLILKQIGD